jgi:hypothetical protein
MTDKMEPVAWMHRMRVYRESKGVWGSWSEWREGKPPFLTPDEFLDYEEAPLYTADQVKELTDRATTAEAALAEARKVIEPFVTAFENRRHIYSKRYKDRDLGYANFDKMPDNWPMDGIKFSMGKFRSLSRWLQANKGDA